MTTLSPHSLKNDLTQRFDKAVHYDQAAQIQKRSATLLLQALPQDQKATHILELGCGTGLLSEKITQRFPQAKLCLTDLAPTMLERTKKRLGQHPSCHYRVMDGEAPHANLPGHFDLIASNLCIQWFHNRKSALERLNQHLAAHGMLIITTLLQGSLKEWRLSCTATGTPCGVPHYPSHETLQQEWPLTGHGQWQCHTLTDPAPSARHFLQGLHQIGASQPVKGYHPAHFSELRRTMTYFDTHYSCITYQIGLGLFQKSA